MGSYWLPGRNSVWSRWHGWGVGALSLSSTRGQEAVDRTAVWSPGGGVGALMEGELRARSDHEHKRVGTYSILGARDTACPQVQGYDMPAVGPPLTPSHVHSVIS